MPLPRLRTSDNEELEQGFARVRERMEVPESFPDAVLEAADRAADEGVDHHAGNRVDRTDLEIVTIDPPGSSDLDQAYHGGRHGDGFRVHYAIADVGALVAPGGPVADEAWVRGVTLYSPGHRAPLHPASLSEGAASLLPGVDRPAVLWTIDLDADGELADVTVERATVRSRAQLTYRQVQDAVDGGDPDPSLGALRAIGEQRRALLQSQGGISLHLPDQEITQDGDGYRLFYDVPLPVEQWNEQISLLAGMAGAQLMLGAGVGILRTLPRPDRETVRRLGHSARALGVAWSDDAVDYASILADLDPADPRHAALITASARLFRGASYEPFVGGRPPEDPAHNAIGGPYAHVTAPLRRLVDRYTNEIALAISTGEAVPDWVLDGFEELPATMTRAKQHQGRLDRAAVDYMEAMVLRSRVGEVFEAVVTAVDDRDTATVQLVEPAVIARVPDAGIESGQAIEVRLDAVDDEAGEVTFSVSSTGS